MGLKLSETLSSSSECPGWHTSVCFILFAASGIDGSSLWQLAARCAWCWAFRMRSWFNVMVVLWQHRGSIIPPLLCRVKQNSRHHYPGSSHKWERAVKSVSWFLFRPDVLRAQEHTRLFVWPVAFISKTQPGCNFTFIQIFSFISSWANACFFSFVTLGGLYLKLREKFGWLQLMHANTSYIHTLETSPLWTAA